MKEELDRIESLGAHGDVRELAGWLAHEDWQLRRAAVDAIVAAALAPEGAALDPTLDMLVGALYSEDNAGLRNAAQEALTRLAPFAAERLAREVEGAPTDVRILLAPALGESGSAEAVAPLLDLAGSEDVNVATAAIIGLGRLRRREALGPLLGVLASGNPWLAFPAVEALGVLGDASAIEPLAARLDDHLLGPTALEALARVGGAAAARALASRVFASRPLRADALDALVRLAGEPAPSELAAVARAAAVEAFRREYQPDRFDELAEHAKAGSPRAEAAVEALGWSGDPRALPVLLVALGRPATQASAAAGLAVILQEPDVVAEVLSYEDRLAAPARLELARILTAGSPVEAALFLADLTGDDDVAYDAAEAAADVADRLDAAREVDPARARRAVDRLLDALESAALEARAVIPRLAVALAAAPGVNRDGLAARAEALLASEDPWLRLAGAEAAAAWSAVTDRFDEAVAAGLADPDPALRLRSVEVAAAATPGARDLFASALSDEDPLVRRAAVAAFARFDDEAAARSLRAAVDDWHGVVAADALAALAAGSGPQAEAALLDASRSGRALLRCVAAEQLAALPTEQARERALEMALSDPEFEVRRAAVASLAAFPDAAETRRAVEPALSDPHRAVRRAALGLASEIGDPALAARVAEVADADEAEDVRGEALVALVALSPDLALERAGRAILDPALAPYAVRALSRLAAADPERLRRYREEEAPPRAAFAIDALRGGTAR